MDEARSVELAKRRVAKEIEDRLKKEADRRNSAYDVYGMGNTKKTVDPLLWRAVELLRGGVCQKNS